MTAEAQTPLIKRVQLNNILSFGPDGVSLDLLPLNVLIGPNGSGKSNFIEAIALMRATATARDVRDVTRKGGGVAEWIWKGATLHPAQLEWIVTNPRGPQPLRHALSFQAVSHRFNLADEKVEYSEAQPGQETPYFFYR